jgi:hypothetical protein
MEPEPSFSSIESLAARIIELLGLPATTTTQEIFSLTLMSITVLATILVAFPLLLKGLRNFIENTPQSNAPSIVWFVLSSFVGGLTKGVIGRDLKEQVDRSQELRNEVAQLKAELHKLYMRNPTEMLPLSVSEVSNWQAPIVASRNRLLSEVDRLRTRSTSYLVFGVILSLAAVALFFFIIFYIDDIDPDASALSYIKDFLPKFTLAVMVQVIASFFLRMHVSSESEIKWTSNELTNIEHRFAAMALSESDMSETLISEFSKTERNFILGKDQKPLRAHDSVPVETMMDILKEVAAKTSPSN